MLRKLSNDVQAWWTYKTFFIYGDRNGDGKIDGDDFRKQRNMAWLSDFYRMKSLLPPELNDPFKTPIKREFWDEFYEAKGKDVLLVEISDMAGVSFFCPIYLLYKCLNGLIL